MAHSVLHPPSFPALIRAGGFAVRVTLFSSLLALCVAVLPISAQALIQHYNLNIPRQSLDTALKDFAHQTGLQIARFSDAVDGSAMVGPVSGELSAQEALKSLLGPSGLSFKMVNDRTIAIVKTGSATSKSSDSHTLSTSGDETAQPEEGKQGGAAKQSFWNRFLLAQVDQGAAAGSSTVEKKKTTGLQSGPREARRDHRHPPRSARSDCSTCRSALLL